MLMYIVCISCDCLSTSSTKDGANIRRKIHIFIRYETIQCYTDITCVCACVCVGGGGGQLTPSHLSCFTKACNSRVPLSKTEQILGKKHYLHKIWNYSVFIQRVCVFCMCVYVCVCACVCVWGGGGQLTPSHPLPLALLMHVTQETSYNLFVSINCPPLSKTEQY